MTQPAVWNDDPECGHDVAYTYQTHYCSYIRVPRLLTLQNPASPGELFLIAAYQWYELWFKVLLTDLRAALEEDGTTYEPVKLLRRGIELFRLFELHADLTESVIVRELGAQKALAPPRGLRASEQLACILRLARRLGRAWPDSRRPTASGLLQAAQEYIERLQAFRTRHEKVLRATLRPPRTSDGPAPGYASWLRLRDLLDLQHGVKAAWTAPGEEPAGFWKPEQVSADENLFITVHQCFELWFQVILDQLDRAVPALQQGDVSEAARCLRRVVQIQRLLVPQIQIPATMLPLDFMRFRHQERICDGQVLRTGLSPASGTESYQFREIEIVCGLRDDPVFQRYLAGTDSLPIRLLTPRQRERLQQPTLPEAFRQAVQRRGIQDLRDLFTPANAPNPNADLAELAETLLDFDQFFRFWRVGHLTMVEKMIGAKSGTGFLGPEYLMETAGIKIQEKNRVFEERQVRPRFFEELWAVRTRLGAY